MDAQTFDHMVAAAARRPTRRTALRLLATALVGVVLPARIARAQDDRPDNDGDGLYDDDETNVYGTRPDIYDTDGDTVGDGEEIYNRDNGLGGPSDPLVNDNAAPPPAEAPPATCLDLGMACSGMELGCCQNAAQSVQCCITDSSGASACIDLGGLFTCPDPAVAPTGCPVGQTDCGGFCADLGTDHGNCGVCGQRCSQVCGPNCNCVSGTCTQACPSGGQTVCNGVCVDLSSDYYNCGSCGFSCGRSEDCEPEAGGFCDGGRCVCPF